MPNRSPHATGGRVRRQSPRDCRRRADAPEARAVAGVRQADRARRPPAAAGGRRGHRAAVVVDRGGWLAAASTCRGSVRRIRTSTHWSPAWSAGSSCCSACWWPLDLLEATAIVGALLGSAGVVGIAIGFAFRDIAENYVAGILLSLRRGFRSRRPHPGRKVRRQGGGADLALDHPDDVRWGTGRGAERAGVQVGGE